MNKRKKWKIIVAVVCISFIQGLQFSVSPILGQISEHYQGVPVSLVQMLVTAPSLISIGVALASGWLAVKVSKKKLLLLASLVQESAGSSLFGLITFLSFLGREWFTESHWDCPQR